MWYRSLLVFVFIMMLAQGVVAAGEVVKLPKPVLEGGMSVEQAIYERRSVRSFSAEGLSLNDVSQLLWAAGGQTVDGITGPTRAYASAGGIYPLDIYLVVGKVEIISPGIYRYDWKEHSLNMVAEGDKRQELAEAAMGQSMIKNAPVTIVLTVEPQKVFSRYGDRGVSRYISMDAGHLGQNVSLEAQSLGLGTVMVGAFMDKEVMKVMDLKKEMPIYIIPVGHAGE
ncbi:MAG: SagB/ThcOx family dehydrogenase [Candidatus Tantalella remota]|nr:SagB/ThcOx family dehydrogenase [Candidatus Tantalella remota]